MIYRRIEHSSSYFLRHNLFAIYEITSQDHDCYYKTIPNGIIGLTVMVEGNAWFSTKEGWESISKSTVYGLIKKPTLIKISRKSRDISIGFNPLFLSLFLRVPMTEVSGRFTNAEHLFSKPNLRELEDKLSKSINDTEILSAIEHFLLKHFKGKLDEPLLSAYTKIAAIEYTRVTQLSQELNLTPRTLLNRFNTKIGLSPKELMKICRINSSLHIKNHNYNSLTDLAYRLGYFDQAHFIHDFKETLGMTPEKYFTSSHLISDFYNSERWSLV